MDVCGWIFVAYIPWCRYHNDTVLVPNDRITRADYNITAADDILGLPWLHTDGCNRWQVKE